MSFFSSFASNWSRMVMDKFFFFFLNYLTHKALFPTKFFLSPSGGLKMTSWPWYVQLPICLSFTLSATCVDYSFIIFLYKEHVQAAVFWTDLCSTCICHISQTALTNLAYELSLYFSCCLGKKGIKKVCWLINFPLLVYLPTQWFILVLLLHWHQFWCNALFLSSTGSVWRKPFLCSVLYGWLKQVQ